MLLNMKIIKSILFYLIAGLFISCANDDDQTSIPKTNLLATIDFTELNANAIPSMIFANDEQGKLIAQINTNSSQEIFELNVEDGYAGSKFTLNYYYDYSSSDEKYITTYYEVPVGIPITYKSNVFNMSNEIKFNFDLTTTSNYQVNIFGLRQQMIDQTDDNLGNLSRTYVYDPNASARKIFIKLHYIDDTGSRRFFYKWVENYKATTEYNFTRSDFNEVSLISPTINDEADDYSSIDLFGKVGTFNCNLYDSLTGNFYNVTEGFDSYSIKYNGGYSDNVAQEESFSTISIPNNITITRPSWDFNYGAVDNSIQTTSQGDFSYVILRTAHENPADNRNWSLFMPSTAQNHKIPELPTTIATYYEHHFDDTSSFDQHYASMILNSTSINYSDLIFNIVNDGFNLEERKKLIKYF